MVPSRPKGSKSSLQAVQANARFGVSSFVDKPVNPFGATGEWVYQQELGLTSNEQLLSNTYNNLVIRFGNDEPEAQIESLMQLALHANEVGFRPDSARFVVLFTDADFHVAGDGALAGITTPNNGDAILDGNVKRVFCRYHGIDGWPGTGSVEKQLWLVAEQHLPQTRLADYTQAIMDFGATVCTRASPSCVLCPLQHACVALREGRVEQLPQPKPGKPLPERRTLMLLLRDDAGRVLLARRPATGVWSRMWSLPEVANHDEARVFFARHAVADFDANTPLPLIEHVFSHYRLHIEPLSWTGVRPAARIGDNEDELRWQPFDSLAEVGLPAPVRKLLDSFA